MRFLRTGELPLEVEGARQLGFVGSGESPFRWWEISIWEGRDGKFLAYAQWISRYQGEEEFNRAWIEDTLLEAWERLREIDPVSELPLPPRDHQGRIERERRRIERRYASQLSELAVEIGLSERGDLRLREPEKKLSLKISMKISEEQRSDLALLLGLPESTHPNDLIRSALRHLLSNDLDD